MPKQKEKSLQDNFLKLLKDLKIGYITGQNPSARAMTGWGFLPAKNAALNFGRLIRNVPVDPEMKIRSNDPANLARKGTAAIGRPERITNTYGKPRVKLAD